MDPNMFVSGAGASRWVPTVASPKLIQHEVRKQGKQQLLEEAASLLPDSDGMTKALLDFKNMHAADYEKTYGELRGIMSEYLSKYNENPYYAFTKEAKDQNRMMQWIVNNPQVKAADKMAENDKALRDKAMKENNLGAYHVVNGQLNIGPDGRPVTVGEWYDLVSNRVGNLGRETSAFQYDMMDSKEVASKIQSVFSNLGINQSEDLQGILSNKKSSNYMQVRNAVNAAKELLTSADRNTLMSNYYSKFYDPRNPDSADPRKAEASIDYIIADFAGKSIINKDDYGTNPYQKAMSESEGGTGPLKPASPYELAWKSTPREVPLIQGSNGMIVQAREIPDFAQNTRFAKDPDTGMEVAKANMYDNKYFSQAGVDLNRVVVAGGNKEDLFNPLVSEDGSSLLTDDVKKNIRVMRGEAAEHIVDVNGRFASPAEIRQLSTITKVNSLASVPNNLRKFFQQRDDGFYKNTQSFVISKVQIPASEGGFIPFTSGLESNASSKLAESLKNKGFKPRTLDDSEAKEFAKSVHDNTLINDRGWFSPEVFEVDLMIPVHSPDHMRAAGGQDALLRGSDVMMENSGSGTGSVRMPDASKATGFKFSDFN